jgi:glycosyltransferase involved in cell wall biosynthesis
MAKQQSIGIISTMEGYPWGGSEELWYETAKFALKEGIKVSISYKAWDSIPDKIKELEALGAKIKLRIYSKKYPSISQRIKGKIIGKPPKIKRINQFQSVFDEKPDRLLLSEGGFGSIAHFYDLYDLLVESQIPYAIIVEQNKEFGTLSKNFFINSREIYSKAQDVFFVSQRNREIAEMMLCMDLNNAKVVRNPVNLKQIEIIPWGSNSKPKLASIGRLYCHAKGQDLLLRALAELKDEHEFELTFYGSGEDAYYLKELTRYLELTEHIKFGGYESSIQNIWSKNQLLVMASHYEGIPLVVVEAMLCGRPCLLTDVAGNTEWIQHLESGYIANSPTVEALVEVLKLAFNQKEKWQGMGEKAASRAEELYDPAPGETIFKLVWE